MSYFKFGLFSVGTDFEEVLKTAQMAETAGFYSISPNDHFFSPFGAPQSPQLECFTLLTAIAGVTTRIRLVPAVAAASFRPPPLLAKIASTLDIASHGRLILGLGAGWYREEYLAHGYPFPTTPGRLAQLDETIQVVKAMWTQEEPTFHGKYFSIDKAYNHPRPQQVPHPPIMLGGSARGLLKIAAARADIVNLIPPTSNGKDFPKDPIATVKFDFKTLIRRIDLLRTFTKEAGRDPEEIEITGLSLLAVSRNAEDTTLREVATSLGFSDLKSAQRAPVTLIGTPQQICEEITRRVKETGIEYLILAPMSDESLELFVEEVMPEFRH